MYFNVPRTLVPRYYFKVLKKKLIERNSFATHFNNVKKSSQGGACARVCYPYMYRGTPLAFP